MRRLRAPHALVPALLFLGCSSTPPPGRTLDPAPSATPAASAKPAPAESTSAVASAAAAPAAPEPAAAPSKYAACEAAPLGMVCIPGGAAVVGSNDHEAREKPEHTV